MRVSDVESFEKPVSQNGNGSLNPLAPIPYNIKLRNSGVLTNIHRVIVCTGYHISLPFLRNYHNDNVTASEASDTILVTDGTQIHNLHKDIFYIPDPTLSFIGVPYYTATFTLFEFQAIVLAAVLSGQANLPSQCEMRAEYLEKLRRKGSGKTFHSLKNEEVRYVSSLVDWVNRDGERVGAQPVEGHTEKWHVANRERLKMMEERFGGVVFKDEGT